MERVTLPRVSRQSQMSLSRATVRSVEDNHLMQEVTEADVYHSETASNRGAPLERWQMVGGTAVPLKQKKEQQSSQKSSQKEDDGFNHNQPKGEAAEALMLYLNGSRSHPVAIIDDRRVRPYNMKEGESASYHAAGSEQMVFFDDAGAYLISLNGKSVKNPNGNETRMASLRHVNKKMQTHKIEKGQKQEDYKHEGESINTEVRVTKGRIEFRAGDKLVGHYDKEANRWELYESGGVFRIIIDGSKVVGQHQSNAHSFRVDATHTHIKFGSNAIWVDGGGCWSTVPIEIKDDPCS